MTSSPATRLYERVLAGGVDSAADLVSVSNNLQMNLGPAEERPRGASMWNCVRPAARLAREGNNTAMAVRVSGTNRQECLNREGIREYPRLSAVDSAICGT